MARSFYRADIDGLRTVAVLPVLFHHAEFSWISGGYIGVDIFFVISGFLITSILMTEIREGRFSILNFYERRARRILPALSAVLVFCIPFALALMTPEEFKDFSQSLIATLLFVSNVLFWLETGYFHPDAEEKPLLHTWSLAIEEQYYIFLPVFLFLMWRYQRRYLLLSIVAIALASLAFSEWAWRNIPTANFYLIFSRAWELFAGSICALIAAKVGAGGQNTGRANLLSLAGLGMIAVALFGFEDATPFPSIFAVLPVLGVALILLYSRQGSITFALLSLAPIVFIGKISYSLYLWHQPLFAFARIQSTGELTDTIYLVLIGATFVLAVLSYYFIETPFRTPNPRLLVTRRSVFLGSALVTLAIGAFGAWGQLTKGRETLWLAYSDPTTVRVYQMVRSIKQDKYNLIDDGDCRVIAGELDAALQQRIRACHAKYGPGILLIGDSIAGDLFGAAVTNSNAPFLIGLGKGGCTFHTEADRPECRIQDYLSFLEAEPGLFRLAVYNQLGTFLLLNEDGESEGEYFVIDTDPAVVGQYTINQPALAKTIAGLTRLADLVDTVWLGPRIEPQIDMGFVLKKGCNFDYTLKQDQTAPFRMLDDALSQAVAKAAHPRLSYMPAEEMLQFDVGRDFITCDAFYWADGVHWSAAGERHFGARLGPLFNDAFARAPAR
ncbi:acyltransferase family protein [Actibacterium ureilyticum]|uniref:acyltransferase family protein n=1 Tax=Actibacterium ureilyticum TaxID=1590614 RepID=UPI000BAAC962|nr:acyltransferase family protein [Actibacterium ureilyticum]